MNEEKNLEGATVKSDPHQGGTAATESIYHGAEAIASQEWETGFIRGLQGRYPISDDPEHLQGYKYGQRLKEILSPRPRCICNKVSTSARTAKKKRGF
jgi:hypothetical protein